MCGQGEMAGLKSVGGVGPNLAPPIMVVVTLIWKFTIHETPTYHPLTRSLPDSPVNSAYRRRSHCDELRDPLISVWDVCGLWVIVLVTTTVMQGLKYMIWIVLYLTIMLPFLLLSRFFHKEDLCPCCGNYLDYWDYDTRYCSLCNYADKLWN